MRKPIRTNVEWKTPDGTNFRWEHVAIEVLMDIRSELQKLNRLLHCPNFQSIPRKLTRISANTAKPKKAKPKKGAL